MSNIFETGISGLLASQRALATTSHNVANSNTEGYSRQRVDFATRPAQLFGNGFVGKGVDASNIARVTDQFLIGQTRLNTTSHQQQVAFSDLASQLDNLLADANLGLAPSIQKFFDSVHAVADDPASIPERQVLLGNAEALVDRMQTLDRRLDDVQSEVNRRLSALVDEVNTLSGSIAELNQDIVIETARAQGRPPNDLLDQRDALVSELSALVDVTTVQQDDGALNIMLGKGQVVVAGFTQIPLGIVANALDASRFEIAYDLNGTQAVISGQLSSGEIGGTLAFRDELLIPAQNRIGRAAVGLAMTVNAQHRAGMDLNGAMGGDFFNLLSGPSVAAAQANAGSITVAFDPANVGGLEASDYRLSHDGANFNLTRIADGATQTLSGAGPFNVEGLIFTVTGAPAAGDSYLIKPTRDIAEHIDLAVTDTRQIAAAGPVRSSEVFANLGDARISAPQILDSTDPNLLATSNITFNNPPTTFQINGAGLFAYTSGADIDINGVRVQLTGVPAAGDQFMIEANANGGGDNANALLLADLQRTQLLEGGNATYQDAYGQLVADVGTQTRQAQISRDATAALLASSQAALQQVAGVNLDEEAANLLKFQQSYQAAAQVIAAADNLFQTLLDAVGR